MEGNQTYPTPPITEAVLEFRFAVERSAADLERFSRKLAKYYPTETVSENLTYGLGSRDPKVERVDAVRRRANSDESEICVLTPTTLSVSQTALYPGWEPFFLRIEKAYKLYKDEFGYSKVERIGLRYINRIDIPIEDGLAQNEQYIALHVSLPPLLDPTNGFHFAVQKNFEDEGLSVIINSATTPPVLPEMASLLLDIDLFTIGAPPQKDIDLINFLDLMRRKKNSIFEACVTDAARQRFYDVSRLG
jgi:uncharacterized protein (TIGR04255 family)